MKKLLLLGLSVVLISGLAFSANANTPPPVPDGDIKMELTKNPVIFNHDNHESVDCVTCHHPVNDVADYRKCSTAGCHDILGNKDKTINSYYGAIHDRQGKYDSCIMCHTKVAREKPEMKKALTSCKGSSCHA